MKELKCYQVGEFDLVAAYYEEHAAEILMQEVGLDREDIDDITECTQEFLSKPTVNEDGEIDESWGETFARITEPGYVGGWE